METTKKTLPDLSGFNGTEGYNYLNFLKNLKFTDGWTYLAEELGAFWLADIVASVQNLEKIKKNNEFIVWKIEVKDKKAVVTAYQDSEEDGSFSQDKLLYKKNNLHRFPRREF